MPVNKKICTTLLALLLLTFAGCSSDDGKVNVISGPGKANTTMLISFNELCGGSVEGFLGKSSRLLTSLKTKEKLSYIEIDTETGAKRELYTTIPFAADSLEIAPDGSKFLYGSRLIDTESSSVKELPSVYIQSGKENTVDTSTLLSYSFSDYSELLLTNPLYYIQKYFTPSSSISIETKEQTHTGSVHIRYTPLGDRSIVKDSSSDSLKSFKDIILPDITSIKNTRIIPNSLRCIFTAGTHENNTQLYILDLYEKKFILMANNIRDYTLSPGRTVIAYIEDGKNGGNDRLLTINMETGLRKEILSLPQIDTAAWSSNGSWIAYSGGSTKIDMGIIKADGSSNEQLTNGMHPYGRPAWSYDGKKLAFTSYDKEKGSSPKVYIITLNNQEDNWKEAPPADSARSYAAARLLDNLKFDTHLFLNGK